MISSFESTEIVYYITTVLEIVYSTYSDSQLDDWTSNCSSNDTQPSIVFRDILSSNLLISNLDISNEVLSLLWWFDSFLVLTDEWCDWLLDEELLDCWYWLRILFWYSVLTSFMKAAWYCSEVDILGSLESSEKKLKRYNYDESTCIQNEYNWMTKHPVLPSNKIIRRRGRRGRWGR